MSSIYTPLFPATTLPEPYHPLSSSDSSVSSPKTRQRRREQLYSEFLSGRHLAIASLPSNIHPASRSPSPSSELRVAAIRKEIQAAAEDAEWETSNAKWAHVSRRCKLGATTGRWIARSRTKERKKWEVYSARRLPEREEDWLAWERKVVERRKGKGKEKAVDVEGPPRSVHEERTDPQRQRVADIVDKVTVWQRGLHETSHVQAGSEGKNQVVRQTPSPEAMEVDEDKRKGLVQSSLGFPVVKRSSQGYITDKGKAKVASQTLGTGPNPELVAEPRIRDVFDGDPDSDLPQPTESRSKRLKTSVSELPELSFLPPSFPSHLPTSTPTGARHKPAIIPTTGESQLDISSPHLPPPHSSSPATRDPAASSSPFVVKRARPLTPSSDDMRMRSHSQISPSALKKARTMSHIPASFSLPRFKASGSSRQPGSSPIAGPSTPRRDNKLPTLSELLAGQQTSGKGGKAKRAALKIASSPRGKEEVGHLRKVLAPIHEGSHEESPMNVDRPQPAPLMRKSSLASPALGPTTPDPRDGPLPDYARAPESPLMTFTQHPSAFMPQMASTPPLGLGGVRSGSGSTGYGYGETATSQGKVSSHVGYVGITGLGVSQSQFLGMEYNSQFDVDREVDRVDALLDKDVDFDGWLRDATDEPEDHVAKDAEMKGSSQSMMDAQASS